MRQRIVQLEKIEKDYKKLEKRLEEKENKFFEIFENVLDILIIVDGKTGKILKCNQLVFYLLGYKEEYLAGKHYSVLFPDGKRNFLKKSKLQDSVFVYKDILRSDGTCCPMDISIATIDWDNKKAILLTFRDSTERKKSDEEREKLLSELQKALENNKILTGLLPICAACKKVRDDGGYWQQIEEYLNSHSDAEFKQGICPDCMRKFYPLYVKK